MGLSFFAAGLWCPCGLALDPSLMLSQYSQRTWTREDGLPQNSVRAITQTADGYLWIATEQGLARFDGVRFASLELLPIDGRIEGLINVLYSDDDTLWVGATGGLYRLSDGRVAEVLTDRGEPAGEVLSIHRDRRSRLWIGTKGALFREEAGRAVPDGGAAEAGLTRVRSIAESPDARLCMANGKVYCFEGDTIIDLDFLVDEAENARLNNIAFDADGALWVGTTGRGLLRYDGSGVTRWDTAEGLPHGFVRAVTTDREGGVWFGCGVSGVTRIGRSGIEVLSSPRGQSGAEVVALFEDREDNLWIGTGGDGLIRLSSTLFTTFSIPEGLRERSIRSVLQDYEGAMWIGTAGGGLHRLSNGRVRVFGADDGLSGRDILSLAVDSRGRVWVGAGGAGIFVQKGNRFVEVEGPGTIIFSIHEDSGGRMWAGGLGVVFRLEGDVFRPVESLRKVNAPAIVSRGDSEVWFANSFGGVVVWRDGEVTHLGEEQGFPGDLTLALYGDAAGGVWIGTHLGGLTYVADGVPFNFTTEHGLCDDSVFSIVEGPAGRLWMSSNIGVFAVAKEEFEALARGEALQVDCRLFGVADGMRSAECNGGQQPSAWRDSAGRLWFATVDGVVRVDPRRIVDVAPPGLLIEEITTGDRTISMPEADRELDLPPDRRELAIRYTAMTLTESERVSFRYRLEGFDETWVEADKRRVAYFTNLPPRRYRFRVQARVPGSPWGEPGATIRFSLQPRFHETRWFLALVLMALLSALFAAHRARVAVLRRRQRQLQDLVAERTRELEEVNNTLEERIAEGVEALRESDRMAAYGHLVAGVAHEVRHPIFALRAAAHLLTQKLVCSDDTKDELEILGRETDRMSRLVDDLLELGRPRELELAPCRPEELIDEALASVESHPDSDLRFVHTADESLPAVRADRPALIQVLVNLLHNACRHAVGATQVSVGAAMSDSGVMVNLTVADDGAGISSVDQEKIFEPFFSGTGGTGLGLAIASRLVREHGGRLTVDSTPGEGAVFTVALIPAEETPGSSHPMLSDENGPDVR